MHIIIATLSRSINTMKKVNDVFGTYFNTSVVYKNLENVLMQI